MHAEIFEYNIEKNIITARQNVIYENKSEKYNLYSDNIEFLRNENFIFTSGNSKSC